MQRLLLYALKDLLFQICVIPRWFAQAFAILRPRHWFFIVTCFNVFYSIFVSFVLLLCSILLIFYGFLFVAMQQNELEKSRKAHIGPAS